MAFYGYKENLRKQGVVPEVKALDQAIEELHRSQNEDCALCGRNAHLIDGNLCVGCFINGGY